MGTLKCMQHRCKVRKVKPYITPGCLIVLGTLDCHASDTHVFSINPPVYRTIKEKGSPLKGIFAADPSLASYDSDLHLWSGLCGPLAPGLGEISGLVWGAGLIIPLSWFFWNRVTLDELKLEGLRMCLYGALLILRENVTTLPGDNFIWICIVWIVQKKKKRKHEGQLLSPPLNIPGP